MIGQKILHYKILEKLGEGGMGIVYLAEDTNLERQVAIKFLPSQIAGDSDERKRFEIEAKAAAALNHPNIATIHAIEKSADEVFLVMEYIAGNNLKDHLKSKRLSIDESLKIAIQIAQGLKVAHTKNIVHRDIKTANIMSSEDHLVKIMDFGLAKFRGAPQLTQIGTTIGTAAYMSPEQARGDDVDQRTDIWSFGVVLYEMLTGQLPFRGDYEQAIIYSALNEEAPSLKSLNPDISDELEAIVMKLLEKDTSKRYQTIADVLSELEKLQSNVSGTFETSPQKSTTTPKMLMWIAAAVLIVVLAGLFIFLPGSDEAVETADVKEKKLERLAILPFSNLKPDADTDYLGYALADQVIGAMSYIKDILVRPSSAIRKYNNQAIDIAAIGSELDVNYILTGNYLKQGDALRLNVELVNIKSNELLWRDVIDEKYENTFRLQDIISEKIIEGLKIQFSSKEQELLNADVPKSALAYEYYLRAVAYPNTSKANLLAIEMLEKALELDSTYSPAYSELGNRNHQQASYTFGGIKQLRQAESFLKKAIALKPDNLLALSQLAILYTEIDKKEEAVEISRKVLKINPNNADAHFSLGYIYRYTGMMEEAREEFDKAIAINPTENYRSAGIVYWLLNQHQKAIETYSLDIESQFSIGSIAAIYYELGDLEKATTFLKKGIDLESNSTNAYFNKSLLAFIDGDTAEAFHYMQKIEQVDLSDGEMFYGIARQYAVFGKTQNALINLRKAVNMGYYNYPGFKLDKTLTPLKDNEEYLEILELAKEKHLAFKKKFFPENS